MYFNNGYFVSGIISANSLSSSNEKNDDGQDYEFATHVVKVKRSGQGNNNASKILELSDSK